jgi:hypothetical protein
MPLFCSRNISSRNDDVLCSIHVSFLQSMIHSIKQRTVEKGNDSEWVAMRVTTGCVGMRNFYCYNGNTYMHT